MDRRARALVAHPLWAEIELRLRHGASPESVKKELAQKFPDQPLPSARTFRRFVVQQPKSWFVSEALAVQLAAERLTEVATSKVLDERRELIDKVKARIERAMANEARMGADLPLLIPEVRANQALLGQLLRDQRADELKLEGRKTAMTNGHGNETPGPEREPETATERVVLELAAAIQTGKTEVVMPILERLFPPPPGTDLVPPGECPAPYPHAHDAKGYVRPPVIDTLAERVEDPPGAPAA